MAISLKKPVHIHVDQQNIQYEDGTERFLKVARELKLPVDYSEEPKVWLVHVISPSTYSEDRFDAMLKGLADLNIGVICCPSAAISMRQVRQITSPTYNSIARVLEMLAAGIHVRLGSDNICDITSPAGSVDLLDEVFVLCNALRYYDIEVLAKLAAGVVLNQNDISRLKIHLVKDSEENCLVASKFLK